MTRSPVAPCGGVVAPSAQRLAPSRLAGPTGTVTVTGSSATGTSLHTLQVALGDEKLERDMPMRPSALGRARVMHGMSSAGLRRGTH